MLTHTPHFRVEEGLTVEVDPKFLIASLGIEPSSADQFEFLGRVKKKFELNTITTSLVVWRNTTALPGWFGHPELSQTKLTLHLNERTARPQLAALSSRGENATFRGTREEVLSVQFEIFLVFQTWVEWIQDILKK